MLTTSFSGIGFMCHTSHVVLFSSIRTLSSLTLKPSPSTLNHLFLTIDNMAPSLFTVTLLAYVQMMEAVTMKYGFVAIVKSVSQLGCVSQDSDALVSQGTVKSLGNPMQKVLNAIQKVRFNKSTLRQASTSEKKGPSLGKQILQKSFLGGEVLTLQNSRTGPPKRLDDSSGVPKARRGFSPVPHQESRAREFVVDSKASMHMVS